MSLVPPFHPVAMLAATDGPAGNGGVVPIPPPATPMEAWAASLLDGVFIVGAVSVSFAIMLCLLRIVRGPTLVDRGVATDTIALQVVALVILLTIRLDTLIDFDAVLIVSILGFVSTVATAQFIGRRRAV